MLSQMVNAKGFLWAVQKEISHSVFRFLGFLGVGGLEKFVRVFYFSSSMYIQYKNVFLGIYMIYLSLHRECSSSRASYHLQGKYRLVTYLPTILYFIILGYDLISKLALHNSDETGTTTAPVFKANEKLIEMNKNVMVCFLCK